MVKVSVIVPVYGVEAYIERCARSLFEQTIKSIEYIFVNDATTDHSVEILLRILNDYPNRRHQVRIINHNLNGGQAAARTSGMKIITGEYMIHCDPDDWVELDAYEKMYDLATKTNADIVTCQHWEICNNQRKLKGISFSGNCQTALVEHCYTGTLWDKLIRSSIIKDFNIYPFEGINFTEDLNVVIRVLCYSKNIISINEPLYNYDVTRETSICCSKNYLSNLFNYQIYSIKNLEDFITQRYKETNNPIFNINLLNVQKFWSKWGLYSSHNFELWSHTWPECHRDILSYKSIDWKFRIFLRIFCNHPKILNILYKFKQ